MSKIEILFAGKGGQGMVTAGIILSIAAGKYDGKHVAQTQSYGAQARGGDANSEVIISDKEIIYPHVINPDILVAMTSDSLAKYQGRVKLGGIIVFDSKIKEVMPRNKCAFFAVPATEEAEKLHEKIIANMVMLGFLQSKTQIVTEESLTRAIEEVSPKKFIQKNLIAFKRGIELAESIKPLQLENAS